MNVHLKVIERKPPHIVVAVLLDGMDGGELVMNPYQLKSLLSILGCGVGPEDSYRFTDLDGQNVTHEACCANCNL